MWQLAHLSKLFTCLVLFWFSDWFLNTGADSPCTPLVMCSQVLPAGENYKMRISPTEEQCRKNRTREARPCGHCPWPLALRQRTGREKRVVESRRAEGTATLLWHWPQYRHPLGWKRQHWYQESEGHAETTSLLEITATDPLKGHWKVGTTDISY